MPSAVGHSTARLGRLGSCSSGAPAVAAHNNTDGLVVINMHFKATELS